MHTSETVRRRDVDLTDRIRTRLFLDVFNITHSSAPETITRTTGVNYLRPAAMLAPVTARLGFRLLWYGRHAGPSWLPGSLPCRAFSPKRGSDCHALS